MELKNRCDSGNREILEHNTRVTLDLLVPQVETELKNRCGEILELLDTHVIPSATTEESRVFFHKM